LCGAAVCVNRHKRPRGPQTGATAGARAGWWTGGGACGGWIIGICALALGLGILIAAVFPVGCLMFLVAFLLIACGIACLRNRR